MNDLEELISGFETEERDREMKNKGIIYFERMDPRLIKILLNKYFDGLTASRCQRVCKLFQRLVNKEIVVEKCLKQVTRIDCYPAIRDFAHCSKCNVIMSKERLKGHEEVDHVKKKYQPMPIVLECKLCQLPYPDHYKRITKKNHYCRLKRVKCKNIDSMENFPWLELLCTKPEGYVGEMNQHECKVKCIECKEIFDFYNRSNSELDSLTTHTSICPERNNNMLLKYNLWPTDSYTDNHTYNSMTRNRSCDICHDSYLDCACRPGKCKCGYKYVFRIIQKVPIAKYGKTERAIKICLNCIKCNSCGNFWKRSGKYRTWHLDKDAYCEACSLKLSLSIK
jgi:hypothetical protein